MRHDWIAPANARRLARAVAMLACLALLAGCRFGAPISFFDEGGQIAQAIDSLRQRLSPPVHVLNVTIEPARISVRVPGPKNRNRVEEWRLERVAMAGMNWDRVSGPHPYELTLINPALEGNLFELDAADFAAAPRLARAALERAALPGKAEVVRIVIARQVFVVPNPASGEVRWTFDVRTEDESVQVFMDTQGTVVGINVDGTKRAKNLDLLRELDLVAEAARTFRFVMGRDAILTAVIVAPRAVTFEVASEFSVLETGQTFAFWRHYNWNLNGLQHTAVRATHDPSIVKGRGRFSIDDADWTLLPKLTAMALAELSMPQGRVTGIELTRPTTTGGLAAVRWRIEVADQDRKGAVLADTAGEVKQVMR
jgi:hypothetical protein